MCETNFSVFNYTTGCEQITIWKMFQNFLQLESVVAKLENNQWDWTPVKIVFEDKTGTHSKCISKFILKNKREKIAQNWNICEKPKKHHLINLVFRTISRSNSVDNLQSQSLPNHYHSLTRNPLDTFRHVLPRPAPAIRGRANLLFSKQPANTKASQPVVGTLSMSYTMSSQSGGGGVYFALLYKHNYGCIWINYRSRALLLARTTRLLGWFAMQRVPAGLAKLC